MSKQFDIIVYGAYSLTGKLVCDYLNRSYSNFIQWAIAGKDRDLLESTKNILRLQESVPIFDVSADDYHSLVEMTSRAKVVINVAGPYLNVGTHIIEACIATDTHYLDIAAEVPFVRKSIDRFHEEAEKKQLKIVHSCGFDSLPADLGVLMMVNTMKDKKLDPVSVRLVLEDSKGVVSANTLASIIEVFESCSLMEHISMINPYYLNPRDEKTHYPSAPTSENMKLLSKSRDSLWVGYDWALKSWTTPYLMQSVDTRVINRSNALQDYTYGEGFTFYERMKAPNIVIAFILSSLYLLFQILLLNMISRKIMKFFLPQPQIKQHMLDSGYFRMKLVGTAQDEKGKTVTIFGHVIGLNGDPGYRQTSKMIAEAAISCVKDEEKAPNKFGVVTPAVAFGPALIDRLKNKGIAFTVVA